MAKTLREISFVYFFHGEPRRFSGGELRLWETRLVNGQLLPAESFANHISEAGHNYFLSESK